DQTDFVNLSPYTTLGYSHIINSKKIAYNLDSIPDIMKGSNILSASISALLSKKIRYGITGTFKSTIETKNHDLRLGIILPAIKDDDDGTKMNFILELILPDTGNKSDKSRKDGTTPWDRKI